jgi:CSLREA domain-containing protein
VPAPLFRSLAAIALTIAAVAALWLSIGYRTEGAISLGNLYVVDSTGDGDLVGSSDICDDGTGHCTLRAAIQASNAHSGIDGIHFNIPTSDPGFSNGGWTISLPRSLPDVTDSVNISGPGASQLIVRANQGTNFSVFSLRGSAAVNLSGMTIENAGGTRPIYGGISNFSTGTVNVSNCLIRNNADVGILDGDASGGTMGHWDPLCPPAGSW